MTNLNEIVKKLKQIPYCEGIIFAGSRREGDHDKNSDYDFTVLISKGKSYYSIFRYKNLLVDICVATEDVIAKQDLVRRRIANPELGIIVFGEIQYDKSGNMKRLQNAARVVWKRGPDKMTTQDKNEAGYLFATFTHKLEKDKDGVAYYSLNEVIKKTIPLFFRLHGAWQPKFFEVEPTLRKIDPIFFKLYRRMNQAVGTKRVKTMIEMLKYLTKKYKLPNTGEIYIKKGN